MAAKDLDTELTESFMAKKVTDLVNRQKIRESQRANSFSFTSQFEGTGKDGKEVKPIHPPDNFDIVGPNATAGTYFSQSRAQQVGQGTTVGGADQQGVTWGATQTEGKSTSKKDSKSTRRKTPSERQVELDEQVAARMAQSILEQEEDDRIRREACAVQRQIERLKMQQRIKSRIETQLAASQRPVDKSVKEMGIDVDTLLSQPKTATMASLHRATLKDEPNATFIRYNMTRMQCNMAHRQYCIQSLQDRQRLRMSLERTCHAYYPAKKAKQLKAIGADDDMACRFPTVAEMHAKQVSADLQLQDHYAEEDVRASQMSEVTKKDDELWAERRKTKGQRAQRLREVPYDTERPYIKRQNMKSPHLPALVHQPEVSKPSTAG